MRSAEIVKRFTENRKVACPHQRGMTTSLAALVLIALSISVEHSVIAKVKRPTSHPTSLPPSIEDHFVTVDGLRVHYIQTGTGRPLVMLHGNAGSVEDFEFGALDFLSANYRVVAIDRPGHGGSDRPAGKATVELQAEMLHRTLSRLAVTDPILVGHSWGASLALAYALQYPDEVSALVLLAPAAYPDGTDNALSRATLRIPIIGELSLLLGRAIVGRRLLKRGLAQAFYPAPLPDKYFYQAASSWLGRKQIKAYFEDESTLDDSLRKMSRRYSEINIPVVVVTSDHDKIVSPDQNARALLAAIPQSQLIEIKDAGHEIPLTHPESIATALRLISLSLASTRVQSR